MLRAGRRNQSFASTHLNHNSSRSHSIFSTRILHVHPEADQGQATRVSEYVPSRLLILRPTVLS